MYTIAHELGTDGMALWELQSDGFKSERPNPGILAAGDRIEVPEPSSPQPVNLNEVNEFVVDRLSPKVGLIFRLAGAVVPNASGMISKDGVQVLTFQTDQAGRAEVDLPPQAENYDLTLELRELRTVLHYQLLIAEPDPLPAAGSSLNDRNAVPVNKYLANLGYPTGRDRTSSPESVARDDALGYIVGGQPGTRRRVLEGNQHQALIEVHQQLPART